jgi:hypothetical protein
MKLSISLRVPWLNLWLQNCHLGLLNEEINRTQSFPFSKCFLAQLTKLPFTFVK